MASQWLINNKKVKDWTIGGKKVKTLTLPNGKVLSFKQGFPIDDIDTATPNGLLYYTVGFSPEVYKNDDQLQIDNTIDGFSLVVDKDNNWYVSGNNKLYKNGTVLYNSVPTSENLSIDSDNNIYSIEFNTTVSSATRVFKNNQVLYSNIGASGTIGVDKNKNIYFSLQKTNSGPSTIYKNNVEIKTLPDAIISFGFDKDGNWYAACKDKKIYKNGNVAYTSGGTIRSMVVDKDGNVYYGGFKTMYKNSEVISTAPLSNAIWSIAVDKNGNWYAGTSDGKVYRNNTIIKTHNENILKIAVNAFGTTTGMWP